MKTMKLTDSQYTLLLLWFLRDKLGSYAWDREWRDGLLKRGKIDGNRATGRWRTFDSLMKLGLLSTWIPEDSMYPDRWKSVLTKTGLEVALAAPKRVIVKLPPVAREYLWPKPVRAEG